MYSQPKIHNTGNSLRDIVDANMEESLGQLMDTSVPSYGNIQKTTNVLSKTLNNGLQHKFFSTI